jgi:hypothetical protein
LVIMVTPHDTTVHPAAPAVKCPHWTIGASGWGHCARGLYGGRPSYGTCAVCQGQPVPAPPPDPWAETCREVAAAQDPAWTQRLAAVEQRVDRLLHPGKYANPRVVGTPPQPCEAARARREFAAAWLASRGKGQVDTTP